jgi:hypothetical protein
MSTAAFLIFFREWRRLTKVLEIRSNAMDVGAGRFTAPIVSTRPLSGRKAVPLTIAS